VCELVNMVQYDATLRSCVFMMIYIQISTKRNLKCVDEESSLSFGAVEKLLLLFFFNCKRTFHIRSMLGAMQQSRQELDRLRTTVDTLGRELEKLNAEVLYWKSETDKRKLQLGEHLLDDPCDPNDDSLWQRLAAREVEAARERVSRTPETAMTLIIELIRDKQEALVSVRLFDLIMMAMIDLWC
jgi:hypothetical protein